MHLIFYILYYKNMKYTINLLNNWEKTVFDKLRLNIWYDCDYPFERDDFKTEDIEIEIMNHRNYQFQQDLHLDFDDWENYEKQMQEIDKKYYSFTLDMFEHWNVSFSLVVDRIYLGYYEFDRSRNIWIIAVSKKLAWSYQEALQLARKEIENYNSYLNWAIYEFSLDEQEIYYSKDLQKSIYNYDFYDSCNGFFDFDDAKDEALRSIKNYLNSNGIEYEDIELVESR